MAKAFFKKNLIALMLACVMIVAPLTLASCQNGQDGINGIDGKDGTNGIDGKDGTNGIDGKDGTNGIDGKDGTNGVDGKDGTAWLTGTAVPSNTAGNDGDFYFDTDSFVLYQKKDGQWAVLQNNFGKPGANGLNGNTPTVTINEDG